jgi:type IV secretory pathway VirB3-like protein
VVLGNKGGLPASSCKTSILRLIKIPLFVCLEVALYREKNLFNLLFIKSLTYSTFYSKKTIFEQSSRRKKCFEYSLTIGI